MRKSSPEPTPEILISLGASPMHKSRMQNEANDLSFLVTRGHKNRYPLLNTIASSTKWAPNPEQLQRLENR